MAPLDPPEGGWPETFGGHRTPAEIAASRERERRRQAALAEQAGPADTSRRAGVIGCTVVACIVAASVALNLWTGSDVFLLGLLALWPGTWIPIIGTWVAIEDVRKGDWKGARETMGLVLSILIMNLIATFLIPTQCRLASY
jgi:hypothetical protein